MELNKGDRVTIINGLGAGENGIITEKQASYNDTRYHVILEGESMPRVYYENNITPFEKDPDDFMDESIDCDCDGCLYIEMATISGGFNSIKLAIWPNEGRGYPHFHFYKNLKPEGGVPKAKINGGGCICFEEAKYFVHARHTEKMTPQEISGLKEFLNETHPDGKITNWEFLIMTWNANNSDKKHLSIDLEIPDYKSDMDTIQKKK